MRTEENWVSQTHKADAAGVQGSQRAVSTEPVVPFTENRACGRPGCSQRLGRGRKGRRYCSDKCRWRARDEELRRLRDLDLEGLIESLACPECREGLVEAVRTRR